MKTLRRNLSTFWYANYLGSEPVVDEYGNKTGELRAIYTPPQRARGNVFQGGNTERSRGYATIQDEGIVDIPICTIVTDDMKIPITVTSRVWVNCKPPASYDHQVIDVGKSLNVVKIACQQVYTNEPHNQV